jgi:hypothetical protein
MPKFECGFTDIPGGATASALLTTWGPTFPVDVGFDPNYVSGPGKIPIPGLKNLPALLDTGATECCIDSVLAAQLNLPVVDTRTLAGVGGAILVNVYLAQVHIPPLSLTIYGMFSGVHLAVGGQVHRVLMGRTFLRHCRLDYEGRIGRVVISNDPPPPPKPPPASPPAPPLPASPLPASPLPQVPETLNPYVGT